MKPFYKDASFWMVIVGAIAAVVGGIFTEAEAELFVSAAALILGYLAKRGVVEKAEAAAEAAANAQIKIMEAQGRMYAQELDVSLGLAKDPEEH